MAEPATAAESPMKARLNPARKGWTREQAQAASVRSAQARAERVAERKLNRYKRHVTKPVNEPLKPEFQPEPDRFVSRTLVRVRKQMNRLADMMTEEEEPAKLDRLAAAFGRLSEIEQRLAGRPLPGSMRPSMDKPIKQSLLDSGPPPAPTEGKIEQE